MKITVRQPNPHRGRIYPVCKTSHVFVQLLSSAALKERKTFTEPELTLVRELGFEVEVMGPE